MMQERACFIDRAACIACGASALDELSSGGFAEEPLHGILAAQAWGESPLPFIAHERWRYVRCSRCGQTFHRRILDPLWMERLYSRWETEEAMRAFMAVHASCQARKDRGAGLIAHALRLHRMAAGAARERAPRVLDFGCGHGEFVAACRVLGFDAVGIDFAPDRRRYGLVDAYASLDELHDARADAPAFDAVTLFEVLEHLADPRGTLERLARLMAQGAVLVLETPDTTGVTGLRSLTDYLAIGPLGHINGFTPATLRAIAQRAGFRAVRPPPAWVTTSWPQVAKTAAKRLLAPLLRPRTSQYFVRQ
jgi:SAM-dependent methyltransferase